MRLAALALVLAALSQAPAFAQDGAALFEEQCSACHNEGGIGTPGLAPPLDRPEFWQALGQDAPRYISGVMTKGFSKSITVRGERYAGMAMMPIAGVSDEEMAVIASWVLSDLGQLDQEVTVTDIASARADKTIAGDLKTMRPETE